MQPPQRYTAKLEEKLAFNEKYVQFDFELLDPPRLEFQAGQYVSIQVSERGERRSYSICSSPDVKHGFQLLLDVEPGGIGSQYMQQLQFGDTVHLLAPMGQFVLAEPEQEEAVVLIATGSGITPYRSMVLDLLQEKQDAREIFLYWGMRYAQQLFWQDEFVELMENFPNFHFHPVISKPVPEWNLCSGRVTDCLSIHELPENAGYYLCGNKPMIEATMGLLADKGVPAERIHHEKFY